MKKIVMKRTTWLSAADFPYCPLPTLSRLTMPASSRDANVGGYGHPSGEGVRPEGRNGKQSTMTVLIGVRESMDDSAMTDLLCSLRASSGISSARQGRTNHLLFIEYDPNLAQRRDILDRLGDRGLHASVAGC
jgi:hypothetical protein